MSVMGFEIRSQESYAEGESFGPTGPYTRVEGRLRYAVDPTHPANEGIVDLQHAPRDADGKVRFEGDVRLLVPADPARGNGALLIDVPNRGRTLAVGSFNRAPRSQTLADPVAVGDGFLFRHGFSVASVAWQWDVPAGPGQLDFQAPLALDAAGQPLGGEVMADIRLNGPARSVPVGHWGHKGYPAADLDDPDARLIVRDYEDGLDTIIARHRWRFAKETPDGDQPSPDSVVLDDGFEPGKCYYLVYRTNHAPVVGTGLLAWRDAAIFLRTPGAHGVAPDGFERVLGFGASQSGRFLRHLLSLGLNRNEDGTRAADGLMVHIAGGIRGEFNHRFAQPSSLFVAGFAHRFPFADDETAEPYSGERDGLLLKSDARDATPKIFNTNTSWEYWRGDASLVHIDPTGTRDLPPRPDVRTYLFAGTQHGGGALPQVSEMPELGFRAACGFNVVEQTPLARAALLNLDAWVREGTDPPPSAHPRLDDETAVPRPQVLERMRAIPSTPELDPGRLQRVRAVELGPKAAQGVAHYPVVEGEEYPAYVSAVDADGNEVAGIRLPDISVPVATHSGWNARHPETGAPEQQVYFLGFSNWFPKTPVEREAAEDPRESLEERYADREAYLAQVREAAVELVRQRYLLEEDLELVVRNCAARWDVAASASEG